METIYNFFISSSKKTVMICFWILTIKNVFSSFSKVSFGILMDEIKAAESESRFWKLHN